MNYGTKVYISTSNNPFVNLAIEDWIFEQISADQQILYLWCNRESVIIGRFQNPWMECNLRAMERDGVLLARRQSGGGAVYHDLGNINFTFFSPRSNYNKEGNFAIVTAALAHYAIPACATERNDILVETNKVSGSAFKLKSDKAYHHGTLLVETDLDNLAYYLEPPASQMETRGTASVRSPVANIKTFCPGLDREQLSERIIEEFFRMYGHEGPVITVSEEEAFGMDGIQEACDRYSRWDWCLGKTPRFTNMLHGTFPWGYIDVWIRTNRGIIEQVSMDSDVLEAGLTEALAESMQGACYRRDAIRERCEKLKNTFRQRQGHLDQLMYWLQESL